MCVAHQHWHECHYHARSSLRDVRWLKNNYSQDFCRFLDGCIGQRVRITIETMDVGESHGCKDVGEEHDHHESMTSCQCSGGCIQDGKTMVSMVCIVFEKELPRDHGDPELIVKSGADVHHSTLWMKGQCITVLVRPESMCHAEHKFAGPIVVDFYVQKSSIEATTSSNVESIIKIMWANARNDVRVIDIDDIAVIDGETMASGEEIDSGSDVRLSGEVDQPAERNGLWLGSIKLCEVVMLARGVVLIEGDVNVRLIMGVIGQ